MDGPGLASGSHRAGSGDGRLRRRTAQAGALARVAFEVDWNTPNQRILTTYRDLPWNAPFYARLGFVELAEPQEHARLNAELESEERAGMRREQRVAMIRFLG